MKSPVSEIRGIGCNRAFLKELTVEGFLLYCFTSHMNSRLSVQPMTRSLFNQQPDGQTASWLAEKSNAVSLLQLAAKELWSIWWTNIELQFMQTFTVQLCLKHSGFFSTSPWQTIFLEILHMVPQKRHGFWLLTKSHLWGNKDDFGIIPKFKKAEISRVFDVENCCDVQLIGRVAAIYIDLHWRMCFHCVSIPTLILSIITFVQSEIVKPEEVRWSGCKNWVAMQ